MNKMKPFLLLKVNRKYLRKQERQFDRQIRAEEQVDTKLKPSPIWFMIPLSSLSFLFPFSYFLTS